MSGSQSSEDWRYIAPLDAVPRGGMREFEVGGLSILVCRVYSELFAVRNQCPHLGLRMEAGRLQEFELNCPHHGACFDIRAGRPVSGPAVTPLVTYPCEERDGHIYVELESR